MPAPAPDLPPLLGESRPFLELLEHVSRAAPLDRPVLVVGERGTGKELVAARLHYLSRRWDRAFVKVNAAALPESLLESELFGHEAGAFTGAARRRAGRFERADGGTLFLDEIASLSPAAQEKVLRVVEYGEFERVGGGGMERVDVRLIAATNLDLPAEAAAGRFRADLLDRLAFEVLTLPPLRAREGDAALLAQHFGRQMAGELGWDRFPGFTGGALATLAAYPWPGNVRELRNVVERAVYRWPEPSRPVGEVAFDPFESPWRPRAKEEEGGGRRAGPDAAAGLDLEAAVAAFERDLLARALAGHRHNQRAAARALGLTYDQLRGRLRKHGLLPQAAAGDAA
ncbi:MAG TPA: phage shock protein operon transcriptional activator [Geminicoccaceae bacterium]|nr:phage shock protein operon transcriptional activator [Geminicoccaceae bacterium]